MNRFAKIKMIYVTGDDNIGFSKPKEGVIMINPKQIQFYYNNGEAIIVKIGGEDIETVYKTYEEFEKTINPSLVILKN